MAARANSGRVDRIRPLDAPSLPGGSGALFGRNGGDADALAVLLDRGAVHRAGDSAAGDAGVVGAVYALRAPWPLLPGVAMRSTGPDDSRPLRPPGAVSGRLSAAMERILRAGDLVRAQPAAGCADMHAQGRICESVQWAANLSIRFHG